MAGSVAANPIAEWDGTAWSALGSGMGAANPYPCVYALAVEGLAYMSAARHESRLPSREPTDMNMRIQPTGVL